MFKFVHSTNGVAPKRKQTRGACAKCRSTKRRCTHQTEEIHRILADTTKQAKETQHLSVPPDGGPNAPGLILEPSNPVTTSTSSIYFGPSHPVSLLNTNASPSSSSSNLDTTMHSEPLFQKSSGVRPSLQEFKIEPHNRRIGVPENMPMVVRAVLPYLEIESLSIIPPAEDVQAMLRVYETEYYGILPILHLAYLDHPGLDDVSRRSLIQAVCLAVCKSPSSKTHLRLGDNPNLLPTRRFASLLLSALKMNIDIALVQNKRVLIQMLAFMTFHAHGADSVDEMVRLAGQAVHYTYSLGLHLRGRDKDEETLFCCVWAVDRLTALVSGRETHMNDGNRRIEIAFGRQSPSLRLLGELLQEMDMTKGRESQDLGESDGQIRRRSLEELLVRAHKEQINAGETACLELLYHIGILLLYTRSNDTSIRPIGQLSIARVINLLRTRATDGLPMLQMVPYAVVVCISALKRDSGGRAAGTQAAMDFQALHGLLEGLVESFWLAEDALQALRQDVSTSP